MGVSPRSMEDIFGKISEAAGPRPGSTGDSKPAEVSVPGRVQKVKAAREAAPGLSLRNAVDIVDALGKFNTVTGPIVLSDAEAQVAQRALRKSTVFGFEQQVKAVIAAINSARAGDPEAVVRKSDAGQYAFSVGNGTYLVIEAGATPRYRTATDQEAKDIKQSWEISG